MALKSVKAGDTISAGSRVYSATGTDRGRIVLDFLDAAGTVIESHLGTIVQAVEADNERSLIEGITVPAGAEEARFSVENMDDTEQVTATEHMINHGPVCLGFTDPPIRTELENAGDLKYTDGATVESLEPAESGSERTADKGTAYLGYDDASLGQYAHWGGINSIPNTLAAHGITDAQADLGESPGDDHVLHRDVDGQPYWAQKFDERVNQGGWRPLSGTTRVPNTGSYEPVGSRLIISNPGKFVSLVYRMDLNAVRYSGDAAIAWILFSSFDGGVTWSGASHAGYMYVGATRVMGSCTWVRSGTPTGDIMLELRVRQVTGTGEIDVSNWSVGSFHLGPNQDFTTADSPLSASVPSSASGSCSKAADVGDSCTASANVTCTPSGGAGGYSYSWAKVSGSDSITSGATSKKCTVSGTHTTADPAATYQTTINCTVTDSAAATATSNDCVVTLSYQKTFNPISVSAPDKSFGCASSTMSDCTASGQLERSVSGGDGNYSDSWTKQSGAGSITSGSTTATPTVSNTAFNTQVTGVYRDTVTDGRGSTGYDDCTVTFTHSYIPPPD